MKRPIDLYIDNLKRLAGVKSDSELARRVGVSKQAIAAWRRRESVPLVQQSIFTALYGPEAAFDEDIGYTATMRERVAILSAFLRIFDQHRDILDPADKKQAYETWAEVLLSFETDMQQIVRSGGWLGVDSQGVPSVFTTSEIARALTAVVEDKQERLGLLRDLLLPDEF